MRPRSLKGRLLRDTMIGLLLSSALYAGLLAYLFRSGSESLIADGLWGQAEDIISELEFDASGAVKLSLHDSMRWGYDAYYQNLKYRVLDADGRVLLSSDADGSALSRLGQAPKLMRDFFTLGEGPNALHVATFPFQSEHGPLYIQTARSDRFFDLAAEAILPVVLETSSAIGLTALLLFGVVVLAGVRRALAPISTASQQARSITARTLSNRIGANGLPSELQPLIEAFNRALQRIEDGYVAQQRFLANAAHELKTPLAVLRGMAELELDREACAPIVTEVTAMGNTVNQLLQLAEASDHATYRFEPLALEPIVREVVESCAGHARSRGVVIEIKAAGNATVTADAAALRLAIRNLLDNAIKFSPEHGRVDVDVEGAVIRISDQGPGIAPEHRALIFERFWRRDRNGEGSGLGLAIVKEILDAHSATIEVAAGERGGVVFVVCLPGGGGETS